MTRDFFASRQSDLEPNLPSPAPSTQVPTRPRTIRFVNLSAAFVGLIGLINLVGWVFDIPTLKSVFPHLATMKANTAICFVFTAPALWLSRTEACRKRNFYLVLLLLSVVSLTAILTLSEYSFHLDFGIDELFFHDSEYSNFATPPGRLAPATGICFVLFSGAILLLDFWPRVSRSLTFLALTVSFICLIGYLYDLPTLYGSGLYTSLAIHTVLGFLVLAVGVLASRSQRGLTALLVESRAQGSNLHTLLLGAIFLPILFGSATLWAQRQGWYGREFTLALFSVLLIAASVVLVLITGIQRQRAEVKRLQTEKALRESEERLRTMADHIPNLLWMAHADGEIFWYNQRWYDYTGKTEEEMQGWGWKSVHDPQILPLVMENWRAALENGRPFEMVFPLRGADGVYRPFLTRTQPVKGENGEVVRWFGTNTDISAERNAQEELRQANRGLEEYAYVSSHDLQEPLRMVNIYTQLLMRDLDQKLDPQTKQYASFVQNGVLRMDQLIRDLLQFSRAVTSQGYDVSTPALVDLNMCLERAAATLAPRVEEAGAMVTSGPLPKVHGEETQLTQVFQNLLSNALKYRSVVESPQIDISSRAQHCDWVISIRDNGIGFDPLYAERIFGLFKRLHKDEYPGTGLGLAICQRVVERHGGRIWAEAEAGKGATFHFSLARVDVNCDENGKVVENRSLSSTSRSQESTA